jgi:O-antigen/teichoic acid export membrane protein
MPSAALSRNRRLLGGMATSLGSKAAGLVSSLVVMSVALQYLGPERFGLWMAVTSLTSMMLAADLGLGSGLLTRLSHTLARGDMAGAGREVASAYALLTIVAGVLVVGLSATAYLALWPSLLNVRDVALAQEAEAIALICLLAFVLNLPLSLIHRVQYARQQVVRSHLWLAGAHVAAVLLVLLATLARMDEVVVVAAAVLPLPLLNLLNSAAYFGRGNRCLAPRWQQIDGAVMRDLVRLGGRFFVLSVLTSVAMGIDGLLVAWSLGLEAAGQYAFIARLFSSLNLLESLLCLPLWPAYAAAIARREGEWVRRHALRMSLVVGGSVAAGGVVLVVGGNDVLAVWLGDADVSFATPSLLAASATMCVLLAMSSPLFMVQNAAGYLRPQTVGWSVFLGGSVVLKVLALPTLYLTAIPVVNAAWFALAVVPAVWFGYRASLRDARLEDRVGSVQGGRRGG